MSPRARRGLLVSAVLVTALGTLAAAGVMWMIGTEPGARFGFERLGAVLPGKLEVGRLGGTLRGPLEVRDLRYHNDRIDLAVDRLALDWNLRDMVRQRIDVYWLEADSVRLTVYADTTRRAPADSLTPELPDLDLPMDFMVRRATVRDLYVTPAGTDTAWKIDDVTMRSVAFRDTLSIGEIAVNSALADLVITGRARTRGRYAVDLDSRWTIHRPGTDDLVGHGRMVGSLDTLRVGQELTAPFAARVDAVVLQPLRGPRFDGVLTFSDVDTRQLDRALPAARASGRVEIEGRLDAYATRGTLDARTVEWGPVLAAFDLENGGGGRFRIRQVTLTRPGRPGELTARGTAQLGGPRPALDLTGGWTALDWPLQGKPTLESSRGTYRVVGPLDGYRLDVDGSLATGPVKDSHWKLAGNGNRQGATLRSIDGQVMGGAMTGSGSLTWNPAVTWRAGLAARDLDPATAWPGWPGTLAMDVKTAGRVDPGGARGTIEIGGLSGTLRGQPVGGHASAELHPDGIALPSLDVTWGADRLTASGSLRSRWDLTWAIDAPDVSVVAPHGGGKLAAHGTLSGDRAAPHVVLSMRADSLRTLTAKLDSLTAEADVDFGGHADSRIDLVAVGIVLPRRSLDRATLHLDGRRSEHNLDLAAVSNTDSLHVVGAGGMPGSTWQGRLTTLHLATEQYGTWGLDSPALLTASRDMARLDSLSWSSQGSRLRAGAGWQRAGTWQLQAALETVRLALANPLLPPGLQLAGPLDGTIAAYGTGGVVRGDANLRAVGGEMTYPSDGKRRGRTPIDSLVVQAVSDERGVSAAGSAALGSAGTVRATFRTPQAGSWGIVDGTLQVRLAELGFLAGLTPELSNVQGRLDGDLRVEGTFARPRWIGEAHLIQGVADMPRLGIHLDQVALDASSDAAGKLQLNGVVRSGTGQLKLDGDATFSADGTPTARATLNGERFTIMNRKDARVVVTPSVTLASIGDSMVVKGEIEVPEADIRSVRVKEQAIRPSPDVTFVGPDSTAIHHRRPLEVYSEVRVALGHAVRFRALGLDGKPTGSVLIIDRPDFPATANGELSLTEGTYMAYGQNLKIDRGRLVFSGGPLVNPNLDVRASRRAGDGTVAGFLVTGTLEAPRFNLFSEPPMAERDALAYVVMGHKLDSANDTQEAVVTDAANTLGLHGGTYIAGTLARQLGISQASIESEGDFEEASLMLGTYLSPRLYVNYGLGITDAVSTLKIQYFLNSKWTLQAEAGSENRAQVLYSVEK